MKKYGSLIALAVVVVLAILVFATRDEPATKVETPYSISKVEKLARIELTQPDDDGRLVVLETDGDGWKITKPVEAPVADRVASGITEALAGKINTDDVKLAQEKAGEFGLGDDEAVKVALFTEGATAPSAEFFVGKTFTVEGTRAKRTYIKSSDGGIYRAQTELGNLLGQPLDDLRSKKIQTMDRNALTDIWVKYPDEDLELHLVKEGADWKLEEPAVDFELERSNVSSLVNSVSNLVAKGFADDKKPADVGLEPPYAEVTAREKEGEPKRLLLSKPADEKAYVKQKRSPHIFEVAETTAKSLTPTLLSLRSRIAKTLDEDSVTRVEFAGDDRVVVAKKGDAWQFVRGAKGPVKESALKSKLSSLTKLRAVRYEPVSVKEAGLDSPNQRVTIVADGARHQLLIGGEADEKGNLWARWSDSDLVMVIPKWIAERVAPAASELTEDES